MNAHAGLGKCKPGLEAKLHPTSLDIAKIQNFYIKVN